MEQIDLLDPRIRQYDWGMTRAPVIPPPKKWQGTGSLRPPKVANLGLLDAGADLLIGAPIEAYFRHQSGQLPHETVIGTAGSTAGGIAGALAPGLLGFKVAGPIGLIGAMGLSTLGSLAGGKLADEVSGLNRRYRNMAAGTVDPAQDMTMSMAPEPRRLEWNEYGFQ